MTEEHGYDIGKKPKCFGFEEILTGKGAMEESLEIAYVEMGDKYIDNGT
jgi:hypothetical protein